MPLEERRTRHEALYQVISDNDLKSWGEHFLAALTNASPLWRPEIGHEPSSVQSSVA